MQRGRADLAETLWQLSNPYKDGRSLGDQWMEARGKQRVPGPELSRGRQVAPPVHCVFPFSSVVEMCLGKGWLFPWGFNERKPRANRAPGFDMSCGCQVMPASQ